MPLQSPLALRYGLCSFLPGLLWPEWKRRRVIRRQMYGWVFFENHVLAKERGLTQPYRSPNTAALDPKFYDEEGY